MNEETLKSDQYKKSICDLQRFKRSSDTDDNDRIISIDMKNKNKFKSFDKRSERQSFSKSIGRKSNK